MIDVNIDSTVDGFNMEKYHYFNLFKKSNTFVNTRDNKGGLLFWKTSASLNLGFNNSKKKTSMAKRITNKNSIKTLKRKIKKTDIIFLHFVGNLRWFRLVLKELLFKKFLVRLIFFKVPVAFNGCRFKKKRRKNRVLSSTVEHWSFKPLVLGSNPKVLRLDSINGNALDCKFNYSGSIPLLA